MTTSFEQNSTIYTTTEITVGKTVYAVTVASGRFNYVNVRKVTANPFGITGKDFPNFEEALKHYKNVSLKFALTKIWMGL